MGIAPWLPEDKQHWITGIAILNALGLPRNSDLRKKLDTVLEALIGEADQQRQRGGSLDGKIMRFRNKRSGEEGSVYVDPVLIETGILTKQLVKNAIVPDATGQDAGDTARHARNGARTWSQRHERSDISPDSGHIERKDRHRGK